MNLKIICNAVLIQHKKILVWIFSMRFYMRQHIEFTVVKMTKIAELGLFLCGNERVRIFFDPIIRLSKNRHLADYHMLRYDLQYYILPEPPICRNFSFFISFLFVEDWQKKGERRWRNHNFWILFMEKITRYAIYSLRRN